MDIQQLERELTRIDGKGYKAYKDIQGTYQGIGDGYTLHIDHVQADPYAAPSRIRVTITGKHANLRAEWYENAHRKVALEDFLARQAGQAIRQFSRKGDPKKLGYLIVDEPGQEILQRTAVRVDQGGIDIRISAGLPARGRSISGREAKKLLLEMLPQVVERTVKHGSIDRLQQQLELSDQQKAIRSFLAEQGYVAFVANGAVLPRESGVSHRPLQNRVVPFKAPSSMEIEIELPHRENLRGMAIRPGITLIVGGGFHGKSTLLKAIEQGVYDHIAGDGREYVIAIDSACKVRAEDGRGVEKVDISPFIGKLPFAKDTVQFSTPDASGSTSQAANIMEMLEVGAQMLLIDEDTTATNFMIRDARMQRLVQKKVEPITPFVDKIRPLYEEHGVSTILVLGGSGDYFDVADTVIMINEFSPIEVTDQAKKIANELQVQRIQEGDNHFGQVSSRRIDWNQLSVNQGQRNKIDAKGLHTIRFGYQTIDLSQVEQLTDSSQTRAIASMLSYLMKKGGKLNLNDELDQLVVQLQQDGLEMVSPFKYQHPGDLALPRKYEIAAAINRLRNLKVI